MLAKTGCANVAYARPVASPRTEESLPRRASLNWRYWPCRFPALDMIPFAAKAIHTMLQLADIFFRTRHGTRTDKGRKLYSYYSCTDEVDASVTAELGGARS